MKATTLFLMLAAALTGCAAPEAEIAETTVTEPALEIFAESDRQWTGVAVTTGGRVFANYPRWSPEIPISVVEVLADGTFAPYPDESWNNWSPDADSATTFVCVQSVVADDKGFLWVLDPANAWFQGVVPGGAKLVQIDPSSDEVVRVIAFDDEMAPAASYLNDVRIDHQHQAAYITDSRGGALLVVDLNTGESRRVLDDHHSTSAEDTVLVFGGHEWLMPDGSPRQVAADGIAYDRTDDMVYYQALTGRTLYRIAGAALRDPSLDDEALAAQVEWVAESGSSDGLLWDGADGIFISAIEDDAVKRWSPEGGVEIVIQDSQIAWPDSFALGPDGGLYVTTSQIHRGPEPGEPYRIFRLTGF